MRDIIIGLAVAAVVVATVVIMHLRATSAEEETAIWKAKAQEQSEQAARWKLAHDQAKAAREAVTAQAQNCLDRVSAARAEAEEWREIFADMSLRAMSGEEAKGVPDDATRRALLADLDSPL